MNSGPDVTKIEGPRDAELEERGLKIARAARFACDRAFGVRGYALKNPAVVAALITAISQGEQEHA